MTLSLSIAEIVQQPTSNIADMTNQRPWLTFPRVAAITFFVVHVPSGGSLPFMFYYSAISAQFFTRSLPWAIGKIRGMWVRSRNRRARSVELRQTGLQHVNADTSPP